MIRILLAALLFLAPAQAGAGALIYQNATASLSSTPAMVAYINAMTPLVQPLAYETVDQKPIVEAVADPNYVMGIYNCATQGTYSVGASLTITGTVAVSATLNLEVQVATETGPWVGLRSVTQPLTVVFPKGSAYVPFLVPCPQKGKIRIVASTDALLPVISSVGKENTLTITKIF